MSLQYVTNATNGKPVAIEVYLIPIESLDNRSRCHPTVALLMPCDKKEHPSMATAKIHL